MMPRIAAAALVTVAGMSALVTHHHKRPPSGLESDVPTVAPLIRASRSHPRPPLTDERPGRRAARVTSRRPAAHRAPARPATRGVLSDVTEYCSTGSRNAAGRWPRLGDVAVIDRSIPFGTRLLIAGRVLVVEDWIGSGSQFDIFGGDDEGCEQRALAFGRQHLRVVVER